MGIGVGAGVWLGVTLVRSGRQREPVLHSQVVESREAGEKLVAQLVKVPLRHGYVEIMKMSTGEGNDNELMPDQKDVAGALPI